MKTFCNSLDNLADEAGVLHRTFHFLVGHFKLDMTSEPEFSLDSLSDDLGACCPTFSKIFRHAVVMYGFWETWFM